MLYICCRDFIGLCGGAFFSTSIRLTNNILPRIIDKTLVIGAHVNCGALEKRFRRTSNSNPSCGGEHRRIRAHLRPAAIFAEDIRTFQNFIHQQQSFADRPYFESHKQIAQNEDALPETQMGIVTKLLLPALVQSHKATARTEAMSRLAFIAIVMHSYRLNHGAFPEKIDELSRDSDLLIPTDPFNGKPMNLVTSGNEITLYSVGPDFEDNQGSKFDHESKAGDLTFKLRVPANEE